MRNKKILILGGQGFIGQNLAIKLIKNGFDVNVFEKNIIESRKLLGCNYISGDFSNIEDYSEMFEDVDVVVHLISTTKPNNIMEQVVFDIETNLLNTVKMLNICVKKQVKKVIFPSSGGTIYGLTKDFPTKESAPKNPICAYGINKLAIEKYLYMYKELYNLDYATLRLTNPYGPYHVAKNQGVIDVFINKILSGEQIEIWGDGSISRDYIFIDDVIDAFMAVIEKTSDEKIFNISSGKAVSLKQIIDILHEVMTEKIDVKYLSARNIDIPISCLDNSLASLALGWSPKTDLRTGIIETIDYYRQ